MLMLLSPFFSNMCLESERFLERVVQLLDFFLRVHNIGFLAVCFFQ